MSDGLAIVIDRNDCIACATCWETCPQFFKENESDGLSEVIEQFRTGGDPARGLAPMELDSCVSDAAEGCPVSIIHIEGRT